jgi:hypothetical protein
MALSIVQYADETGDRWVAAMNGQGVRRVEAARTTYELALQVIDAGLSLAEMLESRLAESVDLDALSRDGALLPAIDHPDPAHLHLTGTGLTHLGSAEGRDKMHKAAASGAQTDSMRMFLMGVEAGKPDVLPGCQPEWFYKGDGGGLLGPTDAIPSPAFALDGGEEPEIAGIYVIDREGNPRRLGFALANEFSDHVTERGNYLWLAHSKLRPAVLGAEILTGDLPEDVRGTSRIIRGGEAIWEAPFLSGEANMSHSIANLEHHHFKYDQFRCPGDVHVHFFGTATLSFAHAIKTEPGDIFEIEAEPFALKLRNELTIAQSNDVRVSAL